MEKKTRKGVLEKDTLNVIAKLLGLELESGEKIVYKYNHPTDDCLCPGHVAISFEPDGKHFYGVPKNAVKWN